MAWSKENLLNLAIAGNKPDLDPHPAGSAGCPSPASRARGEGFATVGVTLMALEPHHCRWPVGLDRAPGEGHELFCAEAKEGRGPYCAHHRRAAS
ncbi:GcrA cell cycle regulator [Roseiarcus fermentans]|uniref:GcrA cell cycle regulator n=1 Tax=Roseiarcus fermentans TaxID=1473586 RepID=A0A366EN58_9HYPH|nr:GcrA family cell cycle regulator [Roseiarcus fermentans]RBP03828.1 GcrA cell cycle regulator [Roseiarcus fermentans]